MPVIGIGNIGTFLPNNFRDILEESERFGLAHSFVNEKSGFRRVSRKDKAVETSDLAVLAFNDLRQAGGLEPSEIECLVVCTQNPDGHGLPHTSAVVHGKLGLPERCAAFDLSLGCSGYVYGISVAKAFMEAQGLRNGVLITADPYSKVLDETDKNTAILFGDGATATHLCGEPDWNIGASRFASDGRSRDAIQVSSDAHLHMNGRAVFTFSATKVPPMIEELIASANMTLDDIDRFVLHQGSRFIVETIAQRLRLPVEKVPFAAADTGNLVSSSIPFLLKDLDPRADKTVILAGFGVGLSWAATILSSARYEN